MNNLTSQNQLVRDASTAAIQIGSSFQTSDGTVSPQGSPLAYTTGMITVVPPVGAVEFIVNPSTDLRVSENSSMSTYDIVKAGTKESIPCAKMSAIYLIKDASNGTMNFRFTII
jgi:hypothetical protein